MDLKKSVGFPALFFVYITKKSITTSVNHSAGENDRYRFRTVTPKG